MLFISAVAHVFCRRTIFLPLIYGCMLISPQAVCLCVCDFVRKDAHALKNVLHTSAYLYTGKRHYFFYSKFEGEASASASTLHKTVYSLFYMHVIYIYF